MSWFYYAFKLPLKIPSGFPALLVVPPAVLVLPSVAVAVIGSVWALRDWVRR